ncbi:AraC family transcriptional regulator [Streptomyces noursei ZPM]|uniref:AraC family transcriptional regulator n=1 Tax=Streptomyces noursei TaxID=1971 RepID=A0A401QT22_STRNR|nr:AraC family transcriptional regulator [Streptomyces noursei]AKA01467.1 AraC family transcriptional regulator [Streptomyces noursei ZPM]EOT00786.1 AraC family transcriptional regulator [Streptomyces noursei CCRC 11814]EXU92182.1 AraC family transcriptional regulator [Streptomyces noursei PD-1]UWS69883.1 AraC family transcriptional regulator [Streptomyces noursei]GCB88505.1 AraC family transcriptional regulator [Streptomyces noursei]
MVAQQQVSAWRPQVPGVVEVFHAHFTEHTYPMHVHDAWTLLIVDDGAVRYDLDRHQRGTPHDTVSLLPPHVPHNGSPTTADGFRKRVLYLDLTQLDESYIGAAVDGPDLADPLLRHRVGQLHAALAHRGDELEAESRLALIGAHLRSHLRPRLTVPPPPATRGVAHALRDLLDARLCQGLTLDEAAGLLHAHPTHLVRAFGAAFGIPPHQYVMARRVEHARRLLLDGRPPTTVATEAGFYDQSHLTRHFKRILGVTPGRYARPERTRDGRHATAPTPQ